MSLGGNTREGRRRLTYTNVVATLALFGAIAGGTALALPGKHSVKADDFAKNSVRAPAIAKAAVRTTEIKNGVVTTAEFKDNSISGADVADQGLGYQDLGSNSVVARARSANPVSSGNGSFANPIDVPLSANGWTQGVNESDTFFGEISFTPPGSCGGGGYLSAFITVPGVNDQGEAGNSFSFPAGGTRPFLTSRPFIFEPGTATPRTVLAHIFDTCANPGENFTVNSIKIDVVATR
jgi:hypothetical protein